jgi:methyl-accepting chemotaxis protein
VVDQVDGILVENRENVKDIIANVREASLKVSDVAGTLEREGTAALQAVRQLAEGLRDAVDRQQVARIVGNVERISTSLRTTLDAADLPGMAAQVKSAVASGKRALENVDLTVMRSREDLYASLQYLLEGLENFSEFARSIRENPSLLFGSQKEQEREGH